MTPATTPISVDEDAAARIAELGMQREFEQMLDKAQEMVPHLRSIRVTLDEDPYGGDPLGVTIRAHRDKTDWQQDQSEDQWGAWKLETFPPEVWTQFALTTLYEAADAR